MAGTTRLQKLVVGPQTIFNKYIKSRFPPLLLHGRRTHFYIFRSLDIKPPPKPAIPRQGKQEATKSRRPALAARSNWVVVLPPLKTSQNTPAPGPIPAPTHPHHSATPAPRPGPQEPPTNGPPDGRCSSVLSRSALPPSLPLPCTPVVSACLLALCVCSQHRRCSCSCCCCCCCSSSPSSSPVKSSFCRRSCRLRKIY